MTRSESLALVGDRIEWGPGSKDSSPVSIDISLLCRSLCLAGRVTQGEDDGPLVECGHVLEDVSGEYLRNGGRSWEKGRKMRKIKMNYSVLINLWKDVSQNLHHTELRRIFRRNYKDWNRDLKNNFGSKTQKSQRLDSGIDTYLCRVRIPAETTGNILQLLK